jgi:hypothetical protein
MGLMPFHQIIPDVGIRETRTVHVLQGQPGLPADDYAFMELYCVDPKCDCRRVLIHVLSRSAVAPVATICHAFEPPKPDALVPEQTFLDPLNSQSDRSEALLRLFLEVLVEDEYYRRRLERHYAIVKDALNDPSHAIHGVVASAAPLRFARDRQVEPYGPCPCGSGEKYKFCCRDRGSDRRA